MDEILGEFLAETFESLETLEQLLLTLETSSEANEPVRDAFRILHTIKGTSGFLGLERLQNVAHHCENLLSKVRDGELAFTPAMSSTLLKAMDTLKIILNGLSDQGNEAVGDDSGIVNELEACLSAETTNELDETVCTDDNIICENVEVPIAPIEFMEPLPEEEKFFQNLDSQLVEKNREDSIAEKTDTGVLSELEKVDFLDVLDQTAKEEEEDYKKTIAEEAHLETILTETTTETVVLDASLPHDMIVTAENIDDIFASIQIDTAPACVPEAPVAFKEDVPEATLSTVKEEKKEVKKATPPKKEEVKAQPSSKTPSPEKQTSTQETFSISSEKENTNANQFIRVNLGIVDNLMTLAGELVLTRNQLLQKKDEISALTNTTTGNVLTRLSHLTTEIQQTIMKTRMQPIENAWVKLPRIVRDMAQDLGKKIQIKQVGADTELDRQVIELIKDPLVHMIRNSADHGIEIPEERKANNKSETGTITLKAYHHGGHIVIEITDDGRGMDIERIKAKALEKEMTTEGHLENLNETQILQFIFKAGFSTAQNVTNFSGRGVGMDVVRTNVEKLGGTIDVQSQNGNGTTFTLKIPLTLSIISVLLIGIGDETFAVPQIFVTEILKPNFSNQTTIEYLNGVPLLRWRNQILPLIDMRQLLGLEDVKNEDAYVVVIQILNRFYGLVVDNVYDSQEIVVKPLAQKLANITTFSGSTILGNGQVVLILDPNNFKINQESNLTSILDNPNSYGYKKQSNHALLLLFKLEGNLKAVPLALVNRIDEISEDAIEVVYGQHILNYREQLIPILGHTEKNTGEKLGVEADLISVLIFVDRGYKFALKIDEIVSILEDSTEIQLENSNKEILGTALIAGKPTSIINCQTYFKKAYPNWQENSTESFYDKKIKKILLLDDSRFFHNLIIPLLNVSGYTVVSAYSASEALYLCREHKNFDVIISDIEMPEKNGYEFIQDLKREEEFASIPVLALSSLHTKKDMEKSRNAGFYEHVSKADHQTLLRFLNQLTKS